MPKRKGIIGLLRCVKRRNRRLLENSALNLGTLGLTEFVIGLLCSLGYPSNDSTLRSCSGSVATSAFHNMDRTFNWATEVDVV